MRGRKKDNGKDKPANDPRPVIKKKLSGHGRVSKETETPERKKPFQDVRENHIEIVIKKSRNDLENIINITGDPVFVRDENFRFTLVNDACCKMLGMERKDIIGKTLADSLPEDQMDHFLEVDRRVLETGEENQCEELVTGHGGKILSIITKKTLYVDDLGNKFIVAVVHDVTEQKRVQDDLREMTRILMDTGKLAQIGGWELDLSTREVTWTEETCRIHGVEPGYKLKLEEAMNFYAPESRPALEKALKKAMETGEPFDLESLLIPAGSSESIWVRSQGRAVYSGDKILKLFGTFQNIDTGKRAEEALRRSEKNLHAAYKLAKIGAWDWKADTDTVTWTEELYRIAGRDPMLPAPTYAEQPNLYTPESWKALERAIERAMETGESYKLELELIRPDGAIRIVNAFGGVKYDSSGRVHGLNGILQDITTQKQVEVEILKKKDEILTVNSQLQELMKNQDRSRLVLLGILEDEQIVRKSLREREEQYRMLVENINDVIYSLDTNGVITYVSPVIERISHYRVEELIGSHFDRLVHPEDLPGLMKEFASMVEGKTGEYEYRLLDKGGTIHYVRTSSRTIIKDGIVAGVTAVLTEITERKIAENRLQELYADLERKVAERTADLEKANLELESFSYTVSHDLRAPLRHINGFLEMFRRELGDIANEKARHYMEVISESANRMGMLIDDLLSFSRMGQAELSMITVNMDALAENVVNDHSDEINARSISVSRNPLPAVKGDMAMLRMVLVNLVSNAVKFTSKTVHPSIEIGCDTKDGENVFYVRDNGAGFDMRYADKLFGVFQRLHSEQDFEGTGIGLATIKRILQRHGGRVWAEGEVGRGACFYFTLPKADEPQRHRDSEDGSYKDDKE